MSYKTFQRHSRHSGLSSLSRHSSYSRHSRVIPDLPVVHDLPAHPGNSTSSSISRESTPFQHSPIRMHILHILQFYSSIGFHRKLHRVPVEQYKLQILQTLHSSKKGRCCDIGQNSYRLRCQDDIFSRIELFPSNVLSSEKANYKNDIQ